MKKFILTAFFALIGSWVFAQERIAVFPFEDMDNVLTRNEALLFYHEFSIEFTNRIRGRTVVPRQDVERLINTEAAFQLSDFSASAKTAEMNRVLNGTQILSGRIGKLGNNIRVAISLYKYPNLEQLPGGATLSAANKTELFSKIPELVRSMQSAIADGDTELSGEIIVAGTTLGGKVDWLLSNAVNGRTYVINLERDETLPRGLNLDFDGREIRLILRGQRAMRRITLASKDSSSAFSVRAGVTLVLENFVTISGDTSDDDTSRMHFDGSLVRVGSGGTLIMNENTAISGNSSGRGVDVNGGAFTMNGGIISDNTPLNAGGVLVRNGGIFTMNGGTISGNSAGNGGGVNIGSNGTFTMNGGNISGNSEFEGASGVSIWSGTFIMTGGSISGNTAEYGSRTVILHNGTFTMTGGTISGNIGVGVSVSTGGVFNLNSPAAKSSISGNTSTRHFEASTAQVHVEGGIFRVNGLQERGY